MSSRSELGTFICDDLLLTFDNLDSFKISLYENENEILQTFTLSYSFYRISEEIVKELINSKLIDGKTVYKFGFGNKVYAEDIIMRFKIDFNKYNTVKTFYNVVKSK